ncbi:MAG: antibiotic biosynthesis monooxygenase [Lentisphaeria bacterium]|nr:antibiotic biosynthesis monooxygenase [Lentisphaeria bacterium]
MIRLNCFYQAKDNRLSDALEAAKALTAASLTQDGCISYDVFESATRPGVLLICETWRDEKALADHSASTPFVKYIAVLNDAGTIKIEKFEF